MSDSKKTMIQVELEYSDEIYSKKAVAGRVDANDFYKKYASPLVEGGNNHRYRPKKAQFDFLVNAEGSRVLDCACGQGRLAIWLALENKDVSAFDFSPSAIKIAQQSAEMSGVGSKIEFAVMDARYLKYEDDCFDIVTGTGCLHHLIKYPEAIRELARVLKPGGKAVFSEPLAWNPLINILRSINIAYRKRVGEHMLTKNDMKTLEREFGQMKLDHFVTVSIITRFIANTNRPLVGIRRRICILLDSMDTQLLRIFPVLKSLSSICYIELTKGKSGLAKV